MVVRGRISNLLELFALLLLNFTVMMYIDVDNLHSALAIAKDQDNQDAVDDVCDALLDAMNEEPLFALAVMLAARNYNNE